MKKLTSMAISCILIGQISSPAYSGETVEKPSAEVSRKVIERTDIAGTDEELRLMLIEFPPAVSSPVHMHPVAGLCYVISGTAESQYEGEDVRVFKAGDSYQDAAAKKHLLFRNPSKTESLKFTCAAKIKKDQQFMLPVKAE